MQLKLRKLYLKSNYKLSQIGIEPSSLLFGMDAVYPIGYEGIVPKNPKDSILTLNNILNKSVAPNTDIVLVGAQSGSNVYSCHNISLFPLETFNLLLATQPDAILLCVINMIYNTVTFLLTNKCSLECKHYAVECSPQNNDVLDDHLITKVISDLSSNSKITTISVSGGEAFMFPVKSLK